MAAYGTATLEGADELARVLRALPKELGDPALASALRKGATVVKKEAEETAPTRTGTLRKNILVKKTKNRDRGEVAYEVGPAQKAFYGLFAEFGTIQQPARPWLRPAWEASKLQALDTIMKTLAKTIDRAAKKLAGRYRASGLSKKARRGRR